MKNNNYYKEFNKENQKIQNKVQNELELQKLKNNLKIIVAIPCYNEESTIGSILLKAKPYADELLVVDDGSTDDTKKIAQAAGATVISHQKNRGYGQAIQSCFLYAKRHDFDILTILDGDGQHDPDEIPNVIKSVLEKKADIAIGSRFLDNKNNHVPRYRRFGIKFLTKLTNMGTKEKYNQLSDGQSGFRCYSKNAIEKLNPKDNDMGVSAELLMQGKKHKLLFAETPIFCRYEGDTSTKNPMGHGVGVIISIIKYLEVEHSLLFFGVPGLILTIAGLISGFWVYIAYKSGGFIPFGPSIFTMLLLIIGVLSGMTGLILHAVINANRREYWRR